MTVADRLYIERLFVDVERTTTENYLQLSDVSIFAPQAGWGKTLCAKSGVLIKCLCHGCTSSPSTFQSTHIFSRRLNGPEPSGRGGGGASMRIVLYSQRRWRWRRVDTIGDGPYVLW